MCNVNVHSEVAGGRGSLLNVAHFDEAVPRPEALLPAVRVGPVPLEWAELYLRIQMKKLLSSSLERRRPRRLSE